MKSSVLLSTLFFTGTVASPGAVRASGQSFHLPIEQQVDVTRARVQANQVSYQRQPLRHH
jgi:hypothetical protein